MLGMRIFIVIILIATWNQEAVDCSDDSYFISARYVQQSDSMIANNATRYGVTFHNPAKNMIIECSVPCSACNQLQVIMTIETDQLVPLEVFLNDVFATKRFVNKGVAIINIEIHDLVYGENTLSAVIGQEQQQETHSVNFQFLPVQFKTYPRTAFSTFASPKIDLQHRRLAASAASQGGFGSVRMFKVADIDPQFLEQHSKTLCALEANSHYVFYAQSVVQSLQEMQDDDVLLFVGGNSKVIFSDPIRLLLPHLTLNIAVFWKPVNNESESLELDDRMVLLRKSSIVQDFVSKWLEFSLLLESSASAFQKAVEHFNGQVHMFDSTIVHKTSSLIPQILVRTLEPSKDEDAGEGFLYSPYCWMDRPVPPKGN